MLTKGAQETFFEKAEMIAKVTDAILTNRPGTDPAMIQRWILSRGPSGMWLFAVLSEQEMAKPEPYEDAVHHLSSALRGTPVFWSNHTGFRIAFLLTKRPQLPGQVVFPGWRKGILQLGVGANGKAAEIPWTEMGHMLIAGITRFGKSNTLMLIAMQAEAEGWMLALCDKSRTTFGMLKNSPQLIAPVASTPDQYVMMLGKVAQIIEERAKLFEKASWMPATLEAYNARATEKLPSVLVVMDEYNSAVSLLGGTSGAFAQQAAQIIWNAGKYGVWMVLAGQDWTKEIVGPVREQMMWRLCLKVENPSISRMVIGRTGAESINVIGRAMTNRLGQIQIYRMEPQQPANPDGLSDDERKIAEFVSLNYDGRLTIDALEDYGMSNRKARAVRVDWENRGLAKQDPMSDNALCLTFSLQLPLPGTDPLSGADQTGLITGQSGLITKNGGLITV